MHLVRLNGEPIAGAFSYAFGDTIEVPSASSLREHRAFCPNHLLYWTMIRGAIEEGRKVFDFGRSTPNDGTYHFKEQWGGVPEQLFWEYRLTSERRSRRRSAQSRSSTPRSRPGSACLWGWRRCSDPTSRGQCLSPLRLLENVRPSD